jgi:hypothetical protein
MKMKRLPEGGREKIGTKVSKPMIAVDLAARSRISLARQESDSSDDEVLSRPKWAELRQSESALSRHAGTRADLRGRTGARHARQACARVGPYGQLRCCGRARALVMPVPGPAPSCAVASAQTAPDVHQPQLHIARPSARRRSQVVFYLP